MTSPSHPLESQITEQDLHRPVSPEELVKAGSVLACLAVEAEVTGTPPTIEEVDTALTEAGTTLSFATPEVSLMRELMNSREFPKRMDPGKRAMLAIGIIEADARISKVQGDSTPISTKPLDHFERLLRKSIGMSRSRSLRHV